jgi:hypothetical protein
MNIKAKKTFSTGRISMFKGECRTIEESNQHYSEYQALLTEGDYIEEDTGSGGGGGKLDVVVSKSNSAYVMNKTYKEISDALHSGKTIVVINDSVEDSHYCSHIIAVAHEADTYYVEVAMTGSGYDVYSCSAETDTPEHYFD